MSPLNFIHKTMLFVSKENTTYGCFSLNCSKYDLFITASSIMTELEYHQLVNGGTFVRDNKTRLSVDQSCIPRS